MTSRSTCCSVAWPVPLPANNEGLPDVAADLCAQCSSIDLYAMLHGPRYETVRLKSKKSSPCPLCRFFATVLLSNKTNPVDQDPEVEFRLWALDSGSAFLNLFTLALKIDAFHGCQVLCLSTSDDTVEFAISPLPNNSRDGQTPIFTILRPELTKINFEVLKDWLTYCKAHHTETCQTLPGYPHQLSCLKVIECQTGAIIKAPKGCEFAALSYVWGQPQDDESSVASRVGFLPPHVPKTISDAIQATIKLNLQYLWVDQYCINQKDEAELAEQIGIMDMVYNLATVTLIAACGEDASYGLPGVSSAPRNQQPAIKIDGRTWVSSESKLEDRIKKSRRWSRARTYQEGLLSRRRLFFTETEIYFECNTICTQESISYDLHDHYDNPQIKSTGIYYGGFGYDARGGLDRHIMAISQRQLTYQSDALNAMGGIFRTFSSMPSPIRHFWGIPMERNFGVHSSWTPNWVATRSSETNETGPDYLDSIFADGLCWIPETASHRREGFPSWSWAGWVGPLRHFEAWDSQYRWTSGVKIWLQRKDGTYNKISESVISEVDAGNASGAVPYTQILRIEIRTIPLTFKYLPENRFKRPFRERNTTYPDPVYFAVISISSDYQYHHGVWYWPLKLSAPVDTNSTLHQQLCAESYDCLLFSPRGPFGLVVREREGLAERLGYVEIYEPLAWKPDGPSGPMSTINRPMAPGLSDYVPNTRKTVILG